MTVVVAQTSDGLIVTGRTNLPQGTQMVISINRRVGPLVDEDDSNVGEFGRFYAGPFTDNTGLLKPGAYTVDVTAAIADVQPGNVARIAGSNWSNYSGPVVQKGELGNTPVVDWNVQIAAGMKPLSKTFPATAVMPGPNVDWAIQAIARRVRVATAAWVEHRENAFYACQSLVKQNLRDPDSADFLTNYSPDLVLRLGQSGYSILQRVRAANGFGGKTVSIFRCDTHLDGDNWKLDDMKEVNF